MKMRKTLCKSSYDNAGLQIEVHCSFIFQPTNHSTLSSTSFIVYANGSCVFFPFDFRREQFGKCSGIHFTHSFLTTHYIRVVCCGKNENNGFFIDSLFIRRIVVSQTKKRKQRNNSEKRITNIKKVDITKTIHAMKIQGQHINDFVAKALLLLLQQKSVVTILTKTINKHDNK